MAPSAAPVRSLPEEPELSAPLNPSNLGPACRSPESHRLWSQFSQPSGNRSPESHRLWSQFRSLRTSSSFCLWNLLALNHAHRILKPPASVEPVTSQPQELELLLAP